MAFKTKDRGYGEKQPATVREWFEARQPSFTEEQLTEALNDRTKRSPGSVELSGRDRDFWNKHSGITNPSNEEVAQASASNAAARMLMDSTSLNGQEMAERLGLSPSTVRHYRAEKKIYSYTRGSAVLYPAWQLTGYGSLIPSLGAVLQALPDNLHPQSVAGLFQTPQPDLVLDGDGVTPKEWLERDGDSEPVVALAKDLHYWI